MGVQHTLPVNNKSSQKTKTGEEDRIILHSRVIMMKKENAKMSILFIHKFDKH